MRCFKLFRYATKKLHHISELWTRINIEYLLSYHIGLWIQLVTRIQYDFDAERRTGEVIFCLNVHVDNNRKFIGLWLWRVWRRDKYTRLSAGQVNLYYNRAGVWFVSNLTLQQFVFELEPYATKWRHTTTLLSSVLNHSPLSLTPSNLWLSSDRIWTGRYVFDYHLSCSSPFIIHMEQTRLLIGKAAVFCNFITFSWYEDGSISNVSDQHYFWSNSKRITIISKKKDKECIGWRTGFWNMKQVSPERDRICQNARHRFQEYSVFYHSSWEPEISQQEVTSGECLLLLS